VTLTVYCSRTVKNYQVGVDKVSPSPRAHSAHGEGNLTAAVNGTTMGHHLGVTDAFLSAREEKGCYPTYKEVMPVIESFETEGIAGGGAR